MLKSAMENLTRRLSHCNESHFYLSTQPLVEERLQSFRTKESNPVNHSWSNISQFYTVPQIDKKQLFLYGGLPKSYEIQTKTFNETCIMIRQPALDIINCLKSTDYTKPAARFVLYGKKGTGKSLSLAHIVHYGLKDNFLIIHVPWVGNWMRRCKESSNSEAKEGFININIDAAAWLLHFKIQNSHLLNNPNLQTSQEVIWSKRESTPKNTPLLQLIEHGINRMKYASDCVVILAEELKNLSNCGICKVLVAIDGFNAFFYPFTRISTEKKEIVHPHKVIVTSAFLSLTKFDWKNAAVVLTVDEIAAGQQDQKSHFPRYLLGKDGFEHLDPFVPVEVANYTPKEITTCLDYYRDRRWLQPYQGQGDEIDLISGSNPYEIMQVCSAL